MTVPPIFATFKLYKGATFSEPLLVKNPDGTAVDLSGWTAECEVTREDGTALFDLTSSPAAGITIDGPTGAITLTLDFAATDVTIDEDGEMWPFVLVLTNPSPTPDYVERLVQGYIIAMP